MDLELLLSAKTQGLLLVITEGQAKHKKNSKKEKHVSSVLQLCPLCLKHRRNGASSLPTMRVCKTVLGIPRSGYSGRFRVS
jgi:hypothetical protein